MSSWPELNAIVNYILDCKPYSYIFIFTLPFNSAFSHLELCINSYPFWVKIWLKTLTLLWGKFCVLEAVPLLAFCTPVSSTNSLEVCICKCQTSCKVYKKAVHGSARDACFAFPVSQTWIAETSECSTDTSICSYPFYHDVSLPSQQ